MGAVLSILIYAGLFYIMLRYGSCGMSHGSHSRRDAGNGDPSHGTHGGAITANDPVCGMSVDPDGGYSRKYHGSDYWFCSRNCLDRFESDPDQYTIEERLAS
jgi:YHS domain-containing protein